MADWVIISSMATAGGTLVLAAATFSSVRSASRSTRLAERTLLAAQRPVLIPSHEDDRSERIRFGDGTFVVVPGHGGVLECDGDRLYMAISLRNGGAGLAVIHGWRVTIADTALGDAPDVDAFRRQLRDLYIPAGSRGFWQGAIRDPADADYEVIRAAAESGTRVMVDLLYGDHEGGQRAIARFGISSPAGAEEDNRAEVLRYWNVDGVEPR
jgi:hypothetical protein